MAYLVKTMTRAERDLAGIYRRIEADTSAQAAKWFNGMEDAINSLEEYPRRNPVTPENKAWRHLLYGKKPYVYRIVYKIEEEFTFCTSDHPDAAEWKKDEEDDIRRKRDGRG